jgi:ribosomal-protein-alanine N-acetyltransferase
LLLSVEALLPASRFVLLVDQSNAPAVALYESCGYRRVGLETDYYARGRHALVMQKGA